MSELVFRVETDMPRMLKNYLRGSCGVSGGLLRRLKSIEGGIKINGIRARAVDVVRQGDIITLAQPENATVEPNSALNAPIVFEDAAAVIFDKPAGMPVHPSAGHRNDTLGNLFAALYPDIVFRPVNRLDKDTSGLCLIAKDPYSANILQGNCHKLYYAAVQGDTDAAGTIDVPIARAEDSIIKRCVREDGRHAVTHYKKLSGNGKYSLLEIELETGRTHQIRVHFSHIGHPLAGDGLYGGLQEDISRHALHCGKMRFICPLTGEEVSAQSEPPKDIKNLFRRTI